MRQLRNKGVCLLLALLCSTATTLLAQKGAGDSSLLYWSKDRRLTLLDFEAPRKVPDTIFIRQQAQENVHRLGVIATAIDVHVKTERGRTTFTIKAVMDKKRSWIAGAGDSISLKHEQGHFDICELYTRIMRRELRKAATLEQSKSIYEKVLAEESAEQDAFDRENTFEAGGVTQRWAEKISRGLAALAAYSNPVVVLTFGK